MLNLNQNIAIATDSYKVSHWSQFPKGLEYSQYYVESRGGKFNKIMVDGIAYMVKILEKGVSCSDVKRAKRLYRKHFGSEVFNEKGWDIIVNELKGNLPIRIRARKGALEKIKKKTLFAVLFVILNAYSTTRRQRFNRMRKFHKGQLFH